MPPQVDLDSPYSWEVTFDLADSNVDGFGTFSHQLQYRYTASDQTLVTVKDYFVTQTFTLDPATPTYSHGQYSGKIQIEMTPISEYIVGANYEIYLTTSYTPAWRPRPADTPATSVTSDSTYLEIFHAYRDIGVSSDNPDLNWISTD